MPDHDLANAQQTVPGGFTVEHFGESGFLIRHKRTGMGCMNLFLICWFTFWTFGCIMVLCQYLTGGKMESGEQIPFWFVVPFWLAEIGVGTILLYLLFCVKTFWMDDQNLVVETSVLRYKRRKMIPKHSIRKFIQVKDGGEDEDSFPSWALKVEADKQVTLIHRQPYEKTYWLGQTLAVWANTEFLEAPMEMKAKRGTNGSRNGR